jgi:hypothetical protein
MLFGALVFGLLAPVISTIIGELIDEFREELLMFFLQNFNSLS